ncbi:class I SAM-dependent methyltransferase [Acinetobacter sp. WCHAc060025]|uniref:class I SAM-dependent methyltransferase n=1 Tax=Acinetobacter sp. WCHAc060025 TaxID=2518625 RepID=UPI001022D089|nr:class I SAM-dependent methyltransferase [Acinetobacter sp. WCHAc060025]RZG78118.1 class I SAM-dependent methyltransferase [Acinetobacter sp. WCHAc060025]
MTHSLHPAAQKGFSSAAELYQQVRPNYPQAVVDWLKDDLKLNPHSTAIDLGSGTGKFLSYLKQATPNVTAVEPVTEMLEQLKIVHPDVQTLQAKSDQIPLDRNSVDAVLCAQAFHWFANTETLTEIHRILKPQGHLGLVWNQRDENVDWVKALADLLATMEGDTPRYHSGQWKQVFEDQSLFELVSSKTFTQLQTGTVENVVSKRLLSTSFIAAMSDAEQLKLKQRFEQIVFEYTGKRAEDEIDFPYTTYVYSFIKQD